MAQLSIQQAHDLVAKALAAAGANDTMAQSVARALVLAESQGLSGHGLSRVGQYTTHLRNGRADGKAMATVARQKGAALLVDAGTGLAFPACDLAIEKAITTARELGVCFAGVSNSHHAGVMVDHLRPVAAAGMVAIAFANSPAAMPATRSLVPPQSLMMSPSKPHSSRRIDVSNSWCSET